MLKKIIYAVKSLFILARHLSNPLSLLNYAFHRPVKLDFKNNISLWTLQPLDAIVAKETIIDDDYGITKNSRWSNLSGKIIDVGAAFGDFSLLASKKIHRSKIVAIEPNKEEYEALLKNIKLNKANNISVFNLAVGTENSYDLFLPASNVHGSTVRLSNNSKKIKIEGRRLDSFIDTRISLLKIDCEGAELDILNSISSRKMKLIKQIVVEYHNHIIPKEDKKIMALLKNFGFNLVRTQNTLIPQTGYIFARRLLN